MSRRRTGRASSLRVLGWRIGAVIALLSFWQVLAISGLFFQDAIPTLPVITRAIGSLFADHDMWVHLSTTIYEFVAATVIGTVAGVAVGLPLGSSVLLRKAYEPYLHYLAPTPKIIFFPVLIMWFGVGTPSKIAMGAIACFFPVALSVAAGLREVSPVVIRVGWSFGASLRQMILKVYLPAIRLPLLNGMRLGIGTALISVLLAETKLSNRGIGFLIIQSYAHFDIPRMYGLLLIVFSVAVIINSMATHLATRTNQQNIR